MDNGIISRFVRNPPPTYQDLEREVASLRDQLDRQMPYTLTHEKVDAEEKSERYRAALAALAGRVKVLEEALDNEKRATTEITKALENCRHDRDNKEAARCRMKASLKACAVHASSNPNSLGQLAQQAFPPSEGYWRMMAARVENEANKALSSSAPCQHEEEAKRLREVANDAIALAMEGWAYAGEYFKTKWNYEGELAELRRRADAGREGA